MSRYPLPPQQKAPPSIPKDLLEYLERTYPDRCPDVHDKEREIWMRAGAVDLIRKLRHHHDKQTEEAMKT
jgi:hypothetical protein